MASVWRELKRRNVVRVVVAYAIVSWLILQLTDVLMPLLSLPEWVGRFVFLLLVVGFLLALFVSWAYELTPEGLKKEKDIDRSQSITHVTGRKLDFVIIGLLAVTLAYFAYDKFVLDPGRDAADTEDVVAGASITASIAVLPFANRSAIDADAFFVDGMHDDLLTRLSKISSLKVISRTSVMQYRDTLKPMRVIGEELGVGSILEGGVQRSGNRIRINVQLIDAMTDNHLWAETYNRQLTADNIFETQEQIASEIAAALNTVLSPDDRKRLAVRPTENLDAYNLYLRGRYFWQRRGEYNIRHAIGLFEQATTLDPQFARAWSSLAAAHITLPSWSDASDAEQNPLALSAAQKALKIDDSLAESYAVLGDMARFDRKWAKAKAYYLRAIASEPKNSTAHLWYGEFLNIVGHTRDALEELLIAYRLDPMHPGTNGELAVTYLWLGDTSNALKYGAATWDLGAPRGLFMQARANQRLGKPERAMEFLEQWAEQVGDDAFVEAFRLFIEAKVDAAKTPLYFEFLVENESILPPNYVPWGHAAFDRIDDAYRLLERAPDSMNVYSWVFFWSSPYLAAFRQDPRFAELVTEHGLVDYWREHGWPDACQQAGDSVICE